ncbi:MAG: acyltransferase [Bacteroidaceae bacterium]|nr:acyltransferase [Bacteroidaceae bacterium]
MDNTPTLPKKKRLEWLDAMRGFTMILVVAVHVSGATFDIQTKISSVQELITLFRMPLFFFVSGFLAYKSSVDWTGKTLGSSLLKKIRVQLIPTIVFLFCFEIYKNHDYVENFIRVLSMSRKGGYWFTWVLLQMFVAYYLYAYCEQKLQNRFKQNFMKWLPVTLLFVFSLCMYESTYLPKFFKYPTTHWAEASSFNLFAGFFCFFVLGNICRRFWQQAEKLFDSTWFFPLLIVLAFFCSVEICLWHNLKFEWRNLPRTIDIIAILGIVLLTFRHYEHTFSKETRVGRTMQYIGTRTLDIYLLHYFFLPTIPCVGVFFKTYRHNVVPELVVTIGMALVVIAFSCLTSAVLRTSPFLKKYLFGKEK